MKKSNLDIQRKIDRASQKRGKIEHKSNIHTIKGVKAMCEDLSIYLIKTCEVTHETLKTYLEP